MSSNRRGFDAEALLAHRDFVRGLALSLVFDEHQAEDVVQEAWLAALKNAPDKPRSLRAWLRRVVRNLALRSVRRELRMRQRVQRMRSPEPPSSASESVERLELERRVVDAVLSLEEPYRTTVVLRFYENQSPSEIAHDAGVNASTVRTRLQRGLDQLRSRLDRDTPGGHHAWIVALATLAGTAAPTAAAGTSAILTGVMAMKSKLVLAALLLACVGTLLVVELGRRSAEKASHAAGRNPTTKTTAIRSKSGSESNKSAGSPTEREPQGPAVNLTGRVNLDSGATGEAVEIEAVAEFVAGRQSDPVHVTVQSGRAFRFNVAPLFGGELPVALRTTIRHATHLAGGTRLAVTIGPVDGKPIVGPLELTLRRGAAVQGAVLKVGGTGHSGVTVAAYLLTDGTPKKDAAASGLTDERGRFHLAMETAGRYLVVAVSPRFQPVARIATVEVGRTLELPAFQTTKGHQISGRVARADGRPSEGAAVTARLVTPGRILKIPQTDDSVSWTPQRVEHAVVTTKVRTDGSYSIDGLRVNTYSVAITSIARVHYGVFDTTDGPRYNRRVEAPAAGVDFEVALARAKFSVQHRGVGIRGVAVFVTDIQENAEYGWQYETGDDGTTTVDVRPRAKYAVEVIARGFRPQRKTVPSPLAGGLALVVFELERESESEKASLAVTAKPHGTPPFPDLPPVMRFKLTPSHGGSVQYRHAVAEGTRYVVRDLSPGDYLLVARPGGEDGREGAFYTVAEARVRLVVDAEASATLYLRPGGRLVVTTRTPDGGTGVRAKCWLETSAGKRLTPTFAKYKRNGSTVSVGRLPPLLGPAFAMDAIAPGRFRLHVEPYASERLRPQVVDVVIEVGRIARVDILLERER